MGRTVAGGAVCVPHDRDRTVTEGPIAGPSQPQVVVGRKLPPRLELHASEVRRKDAIAIAEERLDVVFEHVIDR
jgi:hypothetical protein